MSKQAIRPVCSRREFSKRSLLAVTSAASLFSLRRLGAAEAVSKPNSKVAGVQIGMNVPYSFGSAEMTGEDILKTCVQLGLSAVELRTQSVEVFMGAPTDLIFVPRTAPKAEAEDRAAKLREWRRSAGMEQVKAFRKKYEEAGVRIEIVKVDGIFKMSPEEVDYVFTLARTLGGRAISTEISHEEADLKRLGRFADKHQFMVGYHGHASTGPEHWEKAFSLAKYNGANVDLGHFVAGQNTSPIPFLKKYHERVTHVHVKDRKFHDGPNTPFGQGDTPIVETLRLFRDNQWNIQATIEFEYKVPPGSDRNTEMLRAIQFCKDALA